jgi:8-oxo-dGTP diphosphatase
MKNFPFKAINPDTSQEEIFWYSRSIAVCITVYATDFNNNLCILANKRGPGCPDFIGYWVVPCGYLDFNETTKEAAIRECFEETGIKVPESVVRFVGYEDSVIANRQNVTFRFTANLETIEETTNTFNEDDETSDIKWIPIKDIDNYKWAFNHQQLITNNAK